MNHAWGENRILTHFPAARELYTQLAAGKKSANPLPPPRFISCWISEVCNLDCTYCFFSDTNHDKSHTYIPAEKFVEWLKEVRRYSCNQTEALEFSGGGEPTLHPQFKDIYYNAWRMGFHLGIITHGCNDMPVTDMVDKFKYVRVGLDAASAETHDAIKRNKRKNYWFHKAIENIKFLVAERDRFAADRFTVGIKVVLNQINYHELNKLIDLAVGLNVDYIQIKREHSSNNDLNDFQIEEAQTALSHAGNKSWHGKRTRVLGTMRHAKATVKCFMSPIHTVVTATGKILQCCFFEDRPIGTIFHPFREVWGSDEHRKVVEMTTVSECDKVDCRWNIWNRRMKEVIEDPLASASFI